MLSYPCNQRKQQTSFVIARPVRKLVAAIRSPVPCSLLPLHQLQDGAAADEEEASEGQEGQEDQETQGPRRKTLRGAGAWAASCMSCRAVTSLAAAKPARTENRPRRRKGTYSLTPASRRSIPRARMMPYSRFFRPMKSHTVSTRANTAAPPKTRSFTRAMVRACIRSWPMADQPPSLNT